MGWNWLLVILDMGMTPADGKWIMEPAEGKFLGLMTKDDPSKIPNGATPLAVNVYHNTGDRVSVRPFGYEQFPATATLQTALPGVGSFVVMFRRDGTGVPMYVCNGTMYWFDGVSSTWNTLATGWSNDDFGFSEFNVNTDQSSKFYFGNAVDAFSYWPSDVGYLTSALVGGEATVNVDTTYGFPASGTIKIGGTSVTYVAKTATTFTGCVGTPASATDLPVWQPIVQDAVAPRGNIYLGADNRLFISGNAYIPGGYVQPQAIFFSTYGDASTWANTVVTASTATGPGVFNLVEGGGPVTAMVKDEGTLYFFKQNVVYAATLTDALYSLDTLKPFDGKSQMSGAATKRSVQVSSDKVIFVTQDRQVVGLQRLPYIDYPQMPPISYPIQPTTAAFDFSETASIVFRDLAYIACKTTSDAPFNDAVLIWNHRENIWEGIVEGWHVRDWAVYNDGGGQALYFADASAQNIFKVIGTPTDGPYPLRAIWYSKQFDFGTPGLTKDLFAVYVEGYLKGYTEMTIQLLLDEGGFTSTRTTTISGGDTAILFASPVTNWFGSTTFGSLPFGSNEENDGRRKFRVYLNIGVTSIPFYNAQLVFSSDGSNEYWEVLRFGFLVRQDTQPMRPTLYHTF